ncbi:MAG: hypothetical protein J6Q58_00895 [Clostridia bacterium]|nr:hypothetical protein [Clostridia bacterium]
MGLIKSVNDITYELQGQKTEKEKTKLQKLRKERTKNLLYDFFEIQFQLIPNKQTAYRKLLEQKDFAISEIKKAYFEEYETKLNDENISYINQNYFKILNSVKRQYFEIEKIKAQQQKQQEKQEAEAEQQKAYKWQVIFKILKITFYILLIPFWLFLLLIWCALGVNHKKYKRR